MPQLTQLLPEVVNYGTLENLADAELAPQDASEAEFWSGDPDA